jgi:hypothetical protein
MKKLCSTTYYKLIKRIKTANKRQRKEITISENIKKKIQENRTKKRKRSQG